MKRPIVCCLLVLFAGVAACSDSTDNGGSGGNQSGGAGSGSGGSSGSGGKGGAGLAGGAGKAGTGGGAGKSGTGGSGGGTVVDGGGDAAASAWVGTWVTAPQENESHNGPPVDEDAGLSSLAGATLRQQVRVTIGGSQLRLKLTNEYGCKTQGDDKDENSIEDCAKTDTYDVTMDSVHVAKIQGTDWNGTVDTSTDTVVKFGGKNGVTIKPGQFATSDTFDFALSPLSQIAITMHFTKVPKRISGHPGSRNDSYVQKGDAVSAASFTNPLKKANWYYIMGLDVMADKDTAAVVVFGDSIPDGRGSTTNKNNRWPDIIANRLQENTATKKIAVLNQGIGGNQIAKYPNSWGLGPTAIERFKHDVLDQAGVKWMLVAEGVNDIGNSGADPVAADAGAEGGADGGNDASATYTSNAVPASEVADTIIAAYKDFIKKCHEKGIKAFVVPIPPIGQTNYYRTTAAADAGAADFAAVAAAPSHETARLKVNKWMTDNAGKSEGFDAVMDLNEPITDKTTTPPSMLQQYWADFVTYKDSLHPSPDGHKKMGEAADLNLFK